MIIASFDIGIKNLAFCKMSYNSQLQKNNFTIHDWRLIDCRTSTTDVIAKLDICELATTIIKKLNEIDFNDCDEIILEYQPHLKVRPSKTGLFKQVGGGSVVNTKMKDVSIIVMNYFIMKYIITEGHRMKVRFVSSKNKLTVYDGPYIECKLKTPYAVNKFYSKHYTIYLLRYNQKWLNYFNDFKKKDDLGDSFLQGAWYLMANDSTKQGIKSTKPEKPAKQPRQETKHSEKQTTQAVIPCINKIKLKIHQVSNTNTSSEDTATNASTKIKLKLKTKEPIIEESIIEEPIVEEPIVEKQEQKADTTEIIMPTGQEKLLLIKNSDTSQKIMCQNNIKKMKTFSKVRKPNGNGMYTLNNVCWFVKNTLNTLNTTNTLHNRNLIEKACANDSKLKIAFNFFFGSIDNFIQFYK